MIRAKSRKRREFEGGKGGFLLVFFCFSSLKYFTDKGSDKVIEKVTSYLDILQNLAEEMLDTVAEYRAVIAEKNEDITEKTNTQ